MKKYRILLLVLVMSGFVGISDLHAQKSKKTKSKMEITIVDESGNPVRDAAVSIYKSKMMYDNGNAPIATEETNKKGEVTFKDLAAIEYYISAIKGEKNNRDKSGRSGKLSKGKTKGIRIMIE